ncbi:MAG: peptide-binding protein [Calditerrivibrio sp.]|nr:peptide-binding protein [Calditerrivibrio sp.]
MIKKFLTLFISIFIISACGDNREDTVKRKVNSEKFGDSIIEGSIGEPSNLIPILATDSASHTVSGFIYNGLLKYDKNLNLVGDLAYKWEVSQNRKEITFYLRNGVKWHDGKEFTSEDVKFTYELIIDNNTPTAYDSDFRIIEKLETPDKHTVKVFYKNPYAPALSSWTVSILPSHLLKGKPIAQSELQRHPVGTGPYRFKEWRSGNQITLEAFDEYFEGRPNIDRYTMKIIPDTATMFLELLNQNVDIMGLSPMQYAKQTSNPRFIENYNKYSYLSNSYTYVGYNLKNKLLQDKRVRQALSYATPKDDIIKGVVFGLGEPSYSPFKPGTPWYTDNLTKYEFNLEKARQLLKEAGFEDKNGDGILEKDGNPFKIVITTNQGNQTRSLIAEILQQTWKKIGVSVEIRILEWATFINEYIDKRNFEVVILGWTIPMEPDPFDVWHSSRCGGKNLNFICFQNKEVDKLIEDGRVEFDLEKRKAIYHKISQILAEEQPYTFLYYPKSLIAINKRFKNIEEAPAGIMHNFIDWYVDKKERKYNITK